MDELTPTSAAEIELVRGIYAALNNNDIPAVLAAFDPEIERIEPEGFPAAGTYRGHAEVQVHFAQGRNTWAEGRCEPEQLFAVGGRVVAFLHVHVRLNGSIEWIEGDLADVFTFRNGKAVEMRTFGGQQDALAWAKEQGAERK